MAVFLVVARSDNPQLLSKVASVFPNNYYVVAPGQYLVSAAITAKAVSDLLGLDNAAFGDVMVVGINGYYGWHQMEVWNWISLKEKQ